MKIKFSFQINKIRRFNMKIRRMATFTFALAIVALVVGLAGCERVATMMPDAETPPMMGTEINIGVAVALTGDYAEPYGLPMQRGLELARDEINMLGGPGITFVSVDAMSTVEGGKAAVQQLVDQGVPAIVGIGISSHLKEVFPIAQEAGVIAFSPISSAAGLSALGDYIFRAGLATDKLVPPGIMATQEQLGYKKVATIYDHTDAYSTSGHEEIQKALMANGVEILTMQTCEKGDTDFSQQLTEIMKMTPDALFISTLSQEMIGIIMQAHELGVSEALNIIALEVSDHEVQKAGAAADGVITFTAWSSMAATPGNQAFIQSYQAKYGMEAEPWAAQAYATLHILANAMAKARSTDPAMIRDVLAQTMDFPTVLGNFSFDPNGEAVYDPIVLMVKDGKLQPFETAAMPEMMAR